MNQSTRSPWWMSKQRPRFLQCSRRMPPCPWTIAFGQPGRAGGEEHVERVGERDRVERERPRLGDELLPAERVRQRVAGAARVRDVDDMLERRQPGADGGHLLAPVDVLVAEAVAGDREQHLRLQLAEPVEDAARPELGGARRPDRAEARGGEERDERLGDVREIRDDPVAAADAEPLEPRARPRHLLAQVAEGQLERVTGLRAGEDSDGVDVLVTAERVLRIVQLRAREPHRARHRVRGEHTLVGRLRPDLEEVPERAPEALEIRDRPAMEIVVVVEGEPALDHEPVEVAADLGVRARVGGRRPEHLPLDRGGHDARSRAWWSRPRNAFAHALVPASALSLTTTGPSSIDSSSP